ncbi:hypothetical protein OIE68_40940 [Nocardia vinacea]|uniref:DUF4436 domain-containing protein n=1 Tax=Nocardia vinacea TaxID=96468 RepID=A0ABZ1YJ46_9NOCA|nr:hypothetical protein OIE68_40940 [Nocardia vinacea]
MMRARISAATRTILLPSVFALVLVGLFAAPVAAKPQGVDMSATIDDRDIAETSATEPLRLQPNSTIRVAIALTNNSDGALHIRRVDLAGHVLGLTFFSYSTAVELTIAPGRSEALKYRLDLTGLEGQATGLIVADLAVIGEDGAPIASIPLDTDVRGSLYSVYGLFGIALAVLTALAIADAALAIARHRLSTNRWQRGLRLLAPGIGIGLIFGFTASVLRWWVPDTGLWLAVAGVAASVGFLLGYCSPTPEVEDLAPTEESDETADVETARLPDGATS